jgi:hypothetical protein
MSFWINLGNGIITFAQGVSNALMLSQASAEPNPIVRQQKIQLVLQLRTISDPFLRGQLENEIIRRSE